MDITVERLNNVREIFSHVSCPDGTAAGMICARALAHLAERPSVKFVQYGTDEFRGIRPAHGQLFVDITPPVERWQEWVQYNPVVLDHHETAMHVTLGLGGRYGGLDQSGAMLAMRDVFEPLLAAGDFSVSASELLSWRRFARLASVRDTWKKTDPDWTEACAQADALMLFGSRILVDQAWNRSVDFARIEEVGRLLYDSTRRKVELIGKSAFVRTVTIGGRKMTIGYFNCTDKSTSDVAEYLMVERGCEVAVGYFMLHEDGRPRLQVSLRSQRAADVGLVARSLGGGGHRPAAGFRFPDGFAGSLQDICSTVEHALEQALLPQ